MKKYYLLAIIVFLTQCLISQQDDFKNRVWKEGVYKTIDEIRTNTPKLPIPTDFIADTISFRTATFSKKSHVPVYTLKFETKERKKRIDKYFKKVLAISKNGKLYVPNTMYASFVNTNYMELEILSNEFAVFKDYDIADGMGSVSFIRDRLLMFEDFKRKPFTRMTLLYMIQRKDPELFEEMKETKRKELNLKSFLKKYIERKAIKTP